MSQDIVQFFVFVALPIIVTAFISIILIDYRRRMRYELPGQDITHNFYLESDQ